MFTDPQPVAGNNGDAAMLARPDLWPHQQNALAFVDGKSAAMLAMAMGTGKSRVAIELMVEREASRVLILCPATVVDVWPDQCEKYCPVPYQMEALRDGSVSERTGEALSLLQRTKNLAIVVINYDACWREPFASWALKQHWDMLVMDEAHRIKAPGGVASRFVSRLARQVPFRLALTGTPMPHSPLDLYAQYRALDPRIFGTSFVRFRDRYAVVDTRAGFPIIRRFQREDELAEQMYSIAYRVGAEVMDLPEPMHEIRTCYLGARATKVYRDLERDFYAQVEAGEVTAANAMVRLLRLQQCTSGYAKLAADGDEVSIDTAKKEALADLLQDLDEPVVVFCRFRHDLDTVHGVGFDVGRKTLELSGRRHDLAAWQSGDAPVLAVQTQAGGVGIDLTRARVAVYYSMGLSLGDHLQSLARLQRPGQTRNVIYYYLLASGTVDEKVFAALQDRQDVIEAILSRRREP